MDLTPDPRISRDNLLRVPDLALEREMANKLQQMARICSAAEFLWNDMLPHDYDPFWTALGIALGKLDAEGDPI